MSPFSKSANSLSSNASFANFLNRFRGKYSASISAKLNAYLYWLVSIGFASVSIDGLLTLMTGRDCISDT